MSMISMFEGCEKLKGSKGTIFDLMVTDKTYARIDGGSGAEGYFSQLPDLYFTVDGADNMTVFLRIVVPLSRSIMAVIVVFAMVAYWNDWFTALIYLQKDQYPFPLVLRGILITTEAMNYKKDGTKDPRLDDALDDDFAVDYVRVFDLVEN